MRELWNDLPASQQDAAQQELDGAVIDQKYARRDQRQRFHLREEGALPSDRTNRKVLGRRIHA